MEDAVLSTTQRKRRVIDRISTPTLIGYKLEERYLPRDTAQTGAGCSVRIVLMVDRGAGCETFVGEGDMLQDAVADACGKVYGRGIYLTAWPGNRARDESRVIGQFTDIPLPNGLFSVNVAYGSLPAMLINGCLKAQHIQAHKRLTTARE